VPLALSVIILSTRRSSMAAADAGKLTSFLDRLLRMLWG